MSRESTQRLPVEDQIQMALQLKRGSSAALESVIRVLGPSLGAGLKKRHPSFSAEDIEDVLSIAIQRLWQNRACYDPARGSLASWAFIIADNAAKDYGRKARRRLERSVSPSSLARCVAPAHDAEDAPPATHQALEVILSRLPSADHRILTGFAQAEGAGHWATELALELGMRPGTVRVRCLRLKARIRNELLNAEALS